MSALGRTETAKNKALAGKLSPVMSPKRAEKHGLTDASKSALQCPKRSFAEHRVDSYLWLVVAMWSNNPMRILSKYIEKKNGKTD